MKTTVQRFTIIGTALVLMMVLASCHDLFDKDNDPSTMFEVTIENVSPVYPILKSSAFTTPVGAADPAPLMPGQAYEFEFTAPVGTQLSLATMFAQSNDWIFATDEDGISLYNQDGSQITGDVTAQIDLYDAGTEEDEEVGVGENQAPRQSAPDTGPDDDNPNVRLVENNDLPSNEEMIQVTLTSTGQHRFMIRIENVSNSNTLQTSDGPKPASLSPGVWLVHSADELGLLYTLGQTDYGDGLEAIAEDGNPAELAASLDENTGLTVPLSPGVFAVYEGDNPIFMANTPAPDNGIEAIAEDGQPGMLASILSSSATVSASGVFNQPEGASNPGPLLPGDRYTFSFEANQGERLTFATMYVESNDLFYSPMESGIDLFDGDMPNTGDVTDQVQLWDAGTEMNEEPGVGENQVLRQSDLDTGPEDSNPNVRPVNDQYHYGDTADRIKVTINMVEN
ncbi:MAG: spondin domain-containing protein [Balneolaceae bacterium]|nr:spondin domain-containing protein [Balneolaceae bacterium]